MNRIGGRPLPAASSGSSSPKRITFSRGPPGVFCQSVPGGSGTSTLLVPTGNRLWLTQSCTWNWIQAAAITFSDFAGMKASRRSSSLLTVTGFGVSNRSGR